MQIPAARYRKVEPPTPFTTRTVPIRASMPLQKEGEGLPVLVEHAMSTKTSREQKISRSHTTLLVLESMKRLSFPVSKDGSVAFLRPGNFCLSVVLSQVSPR